ncbi:MAG: HRDC domain-containing protein, partial [Anaerolineae bacterium]
GSAVGLTGNGGSSGSYPSPESRLAASMIGGGPVAQALMGAPNPYMGSGSGGLIGAAGDRLGALKGGAQAAVSAAVGAGTGGIGFLAGAAAASKGASFGALALGGQTASTLGGRSAGRGFSAGAGLGMLRRTMSGRSGLTRTTRRTADGGSDPTTPTGGSTPTAPTSGRRRQSSASFRQALNATTSGQGGSGSPPALGPVQSIAAGQTADLSNWTPGGATQVRDTAAGLAAAPAEVQQGAYNLMQASHDVAGEWADDGQSPALDDGILDPAFAEAVTERAPAAARAFTVGQAKAGIPPEQQVRRSEVIALGAAGSRTIPARQVQRSFARAIRDTGGGGDFGAALQDQLGTGPEAVFGEKASQAVQAAAQMQQNGLGNDLGRQLAETVQEDLGRYPSVSPQQFRDRRLGRMRQWDRATGDPARTDDMVESLIGLGAFGPATVHDAPRLKQPGRTPTATKVTAPTPQPTASPAPDAEHVTPEGQAYDPALFEDLRAWRKAEADGMDKAAFHVFTDATLGRIAAAQPRTRDELLAVKGVGPKKLDQFGQAVLDITRKQPKEDAS